MLSFTPNFEIENPLSLECPRETGLDGTAQICPNGDYVQATGGGLQHVLGTQHTRRT